MSHFKRVESDFIQNWEEVDGPFDPRRRNHSRNDRMDLVNSSMDRSRIPIKLFRSARETCQETRTPARILAKQNRRLHWRSRSHLTIPWIQTTMHHEADLHNCECFLSSGRLEKSFGLIITIFMQSRLSLMGLFSRKFVRKL